MPISLLDFLRWCREMSSAARATHLSRTARVSEVMTLYYGPLAGHPLAVQVCLRCVRDAFNFTRTNFLRRVRGLRWEQEQLHLIPFFFFFFFFLPLLTQRHNVLECGRRGGGGGGMSKAWVSPWWSKDVTSCLQAIHNIPVSAWEWTEIWRKEWRSASRESLAEDEDRWPLGLQSNWSHWFIGCHTEEKFLPRLFPESLNKSRSELWDVLIVSLRSAVATAVKQWNFAPFVFTGVSLETLVAFPTRRRTWMQ